MILSHSKHMLSLAITISLSTLCMPARADESTLCNAREEIYFSCHVGTKIISVCAAGNISPKNGYVQYRFGSADHIELEYPESPFPPEGYFSVSDINEGNAQFTHLKFRSGKYDYIIYSGFPSGLYVRKSGKTVLNKVCDSGNYSSLSSRVFRGIATVPPADDIDH